MYMADLATNQTQNACWNMKPHGHALPYKPVKLHEGGKLCGGGEVSCVEVISFVEVRWYVVWR